YGFDIGRCSIRAMHGTLFSSLMLTLITLVEEDCIDIPLKKGTYEFTCPRNCKRGQVYEAVSPIDLASDQLCDLAKDGVLLCKLINVAVPGTIDEQAINIKKVLNPWGEMRTAPLPSIWQRLLDPHLVLGLISQIIKDVEELISLPPEKLFWVHVAPGGRSSLAFLFGGPPPNGKSFMAFSLCNSATESILHCLLECLAAWEVWSILDPDILPVSAAASFSNWFKGVIRDFQHGSDQDLTLKIQDLLTRDWKVYFEHSFIEVNCVADWLAKSVLLNLWDMLNGSLQAVISMTLLLLI
ncbi:hypothetical protein PIB30_092903, partial [Stylosanthes scabra]|nr:hypothetical protein [Stylosanthes scabra]